MTRLFSVFSDLYPLQDDPKQQIRINALISFFVVAFLYIFKPFGLNDVEADAIEMVIVYGGYGLVTFLIAVFSDRIVKAAFPHFFDEQNWTVGKHIFWLTFVVLLIGVGNLFYSNLLGFTGISGTSFLMFQFYTVVVAVFPVTILTLINRMRLLSKNLEDVRQINISLEKPVTILTDSAPLVFSSENGKDELRLRCDQFVFAESADNYTDVVYVDNGITRRALIRSTLKRLEGLNEHPCLVRPHRTYLVNLLKVSSVIGNSQGYRLAFKELEETVPVARKNSTAIRQQLADLHSKA